KKTLALTEESRITPLTVNDFKELLRSTPLNIHVENQKDERLNRLSVPIFTNNDLTLYCLLEDAKTIKARCFVYHFTVTDGSAGLPNPPCTLCTCHFKS
ncbi:uncharacterized protein DEA37_0004070, partial [Paragonimus westermani]